MPEQEKQKPRHTEGEEKSEDKIKIKWRVVGVGTKEEEVGKGTKLSDFLKKKDRLDLKGKNLFRNNKRMDQDGKLKLDPVLENGDMLSLTEGQIVKGR